LTFTIILSTEKYLEESQSDDLCLTIDINENVSEIVDLLAEMENKSGYLTHNGKLLENPGDITFAKIFALPTDSFVVHSGQGDSGKSKMWVRFPEFYLTDYYYMNRTYYDAVVFIPLTNIKFHGFGVMANYNQNDMVYIV
jgi:hypothetical protein